MPKSGPDPDSGHNFQGTVSGTPEPDPCPDPEPDKDLVPYPDPAPDPNFTLFWCCF